MHCNIWGPFNVIAHAGHQYFVKLANDCTRFTWIFLLKHKSDVQLTIPIFFIMVSLSHKSDNARELAFIAFFNAQGVLHQYSCVHRPHQNSIVERKHQHLLNVVRAIYFQSQVPIQFWSKCILTAIFLINRTPSPLLGKKTPYTINQLAILP